MNENKLNNDIKENEESIEGVSNDNVKSDINTETDGVFNCENFNMKKGKSVVATMVILGLGLCLGSSLIVLKKHMNESTIAKDIISISSLKGVPSTFFHISVCKRLPSFSIEFISSFGITSFKKSLSI